LAEWLAQAPWTYLVCGILAGLISALVWFHFRGRRQPKEQAPEPAT
jgi:H+/Cl- antiporter ClcA